MTPEEEAALIAELNTQIASLSRLRDALIAARDLRDVFPAQARDDIVSHVKGEFDKVKGQK